MDWEPDKPKDEGVRIQKFIMEFKKYPNGAVYFNRCYPIGEYAKTVKKPKKSKKILKGVDSVEEEVL